MFKFYFIILQEYTKFKKGDVGNVTAKLLHNPRLFCCIY